MVGSKVWWGIEVLMACWVDGMWPYGVEGVMVVEVLQQWGF